MQQSSNLKQFYDIQPIDFKLILKEFTKSIHENIFELNRDHLFLNSDLVKFNQTTWKMRPDYFCADYYEHYFIYPVILRCNNLKTIFEFVPENLHEQYIIAPRLKNIIQILRFRLK